MKLKKFEQTLLKKLKKEFLNEKDARKIADYYGVTRDGYEIIIADLITKGKIYSFKKEGKEYYGLKKYKK